MTEPRPNLPPNVRLPFSHEHDAPTRARRALRPLLSDPAPDALGGGRGLRIVDATADEWGVDRTPTGKIVWAEFDRDHRTEP